MLVVYNERSAKWNFISRDYSDVCFICFVQSRRYCMITFMQKRRIQGYVIYTYMAVYLPYFFFKFLSKHFFFWKKVDVKLMNIASVLLILESSSFISRRYLASNKCVAHTSIFSAFSTLCTAELKFCFNSWSLF